MTPLKEHHVFRSVEYEIDGRELTVGLEIVKDKPVVSFRLKGYRTGWMLDLRAVAEFAALHPRDTDPYLELRPSYDPEEVKRWAEWRLAKARKKENREKKENQVVRVDPGVKSRGKRSSIPGGELLG